MLSTGVSGSLFPGKTWVGGAAPACPRARARHRGGNAGLGQSCRLGTKGLRACGRPAPASPGPPPAPNEQQTRGAGLSPAPARGDLIWDTATGPGAPALLCPRPTARPPAQAPGVSMGTPKLLLAQGPQSCSWHEGPKAAAGTALPQEPSPAVAAPVPRPSLHPPGGAACTLPARTPKRPQLPSSCTCTQAPGCRVRLRARSAVPWGPAHTRARPPRAPGPPRVGSEDKQPLCGRGSAGGCSPGREAKGNSTGAQHSACPRR